MTIALHVHNVQTIHKSKYKNYETRNTMSIRYTMSREIVNCANPRTINSLDNIF